MPKRIIIVGLILLTIFSPLANLVGMTSQPITVHAEEPPKAKPADCEGSFDKWTAMCLVLSITASVTYFIFENISSPLLTLGGYFMDTSIGLSLESLDANIGGPNPAILEGWKMARDISNMFFIFILLFIALKTVLGLSGDTKSAIVRVVLAAILINFSLTATRLVADAGNATALIFLNMTKTDLKKQQHPTLSSRIVTDMQILSMTGLDTGTPSSDNREIKDIVEQFAGGPPRGWWSRTFTDSGYFNVLTLKNFIIHMIGLNIFILMAAVILSAGAILFLIRTVVIIILGVLSPFAFITWAYKGSLPDWWLPRLLKEVFFAPVFFIMMLVSLGVISSIPVQASSGIVSQVMFYFTACYLLILCITMASKMGATGGGKVASFATGALAGAGLSTAHFLKRQSAGRTLGALGNVAKNSNSATARRLGGFVTKTTGYDDLEKSRKARVAEQVAHHKNLGEIDKGALEKDKFKAEQEAKTQFGKLGASGYQSAKAQNVVDKEIARRKSAGITAMTTAEIATMHTAEKAKLSHLSSEEAVTSQAHFDTKTKHENEAKERQEKFRNLNRPYVAPAGANFIQSAAGSVTRFGTRSTTYAALNEMGKQAETNRKTLEKYKSVEARITKVKVKMDETREAIRVEEAGITGASDPAKVRAEINRLKDKLDALESEETTLTATLASLDYNKAGASAKAAATPAPGGGGGGTP